MSEGIPNRVIIFLVITHFIPGLNLIDNVSDGFHVIFSIGLTLEPRSGIEAHLIDPLPVSSSLVVGPFHLSLILSLP